MKTAEEEILDALYHFTWQARKLALEKLIARRELSAYKSGMTEAADIMRDAPPYFERGEIITHLLNARDAKKEIV